MSASSVRPNLLLYFEVIVSVTCPWAVPVVSWPILMMFVLIRRMGNRSLCTADSVTKVASDPGSIKALRVTFSPLEALHCTKAVASNTFVVCTFRVNSEFTHALQFAHGLAADVSWTSDWVC